MLFFKDFTPSGTLASALLAPRSIRTFYSELQRVAVRTGSICPLSLYFTTELPSVPVLNIQSAYLTLITETWDIDGSFFRPRVAVFTRILSVFSYRGASEGGCSSAVLEMCHRLQMLWVYAQRVAAQMVDNIVFWNRASKQCPSQPVRCQVGSEKLQRSVRKFSVSRFYTSHPHPAPRGVRVLIHAVEEELSSVVKPLFGDHDLGGFHSETLPFPKLLGQVNSSQFVDLLVSDALI